MEHHIIKEIDTQYTGDAVMLLHISVQITIRSGNYLFCYKDFYSLSSSSMVYVVNIVIKLRKIIDRTTSIQRNVQFKYNYSLISFFIGSSIIKSHSYQSKNKSTRRREELVHTEMPIVFLKCFRRTKLIRCYFQYKNCFYL